MVYTVGGFQGPMAGVGSQIRHFAASHAHARLPVEFPTTSSLDNGDASHGRLSRVDGAAESKMSHGIRAGVQNVVESTLHFCSRLTPPDYFHDRVEQTDAAI